MKNSWKKIQIQLKIYKTLCKSKAPLTDMFTVRVHNPSKKIHHNFSEVISPEQTQAEIELFKMQHQKIIEAA